MPRIRESTAQEIWDQSPHNWNDLKQTLQSHPERFGGMSVELRNDLCRLSDKMQTQGEAFPTSEQHLYELLLNRLGVYSS